MAVYIRAKRVTDPLDERVRARLRGEMTGYASSGSEHDGAAGDDQSCFSGLLHAFLEIGDGGDEADHGGGESDSDDSDDGGAAIERAAEEAEKLRQLLDPKESNDPFRIRLRTEVAAAAAALRRSELGFRRAVMARLRDRGYNAGICKARWTSAGGLTAGSYEYIDVVEAPSVAEAAAEVEGGDRYIVDLGFAEEFEVARATEEYGRLAEGLPTLAVARPEEVRSALRIVAEAAQRSLKRRGMSVPPWRKIRYMMAKWLGPYRRTVNPIPAAEAEATAYGGSGDLTCREIGFCAAPIRRGVPARTR